MAEEIMQAFSTIHVILLFFSILLGVAGQIFFKFFSISNGINWALLALALFFYGISTIFYLFSLKGIPLSIAYPSLSIGYILVVIIASFLFEEPITKYKILGVIMICLGVLLLFKE